MIVSYILKRKFIKWIKARNKDFMEDSLLMEGSTFIYMLRRDRKIRVAYFDWHSRCFKRETPAWG